MKIFLILLLLVGGCAKNSDVEWEKISKVVKEKSK